MKKRLLKLLLSELLKTGDLTFSMATSKVQRQLYKSYDLRFSMRRIDQELRELDEELMYKRVQGYV